MSFTKLFNQIREQDLQREKFLNEHKKTLDDMKEKIMEMNKDMRLYEEAVSSEVNGNRVKKNVVGEIATLNLRIEEIKKIGSKVT